MNWSEHVKNRNAVPVEQLSPYENQHVAWSLDGTHILAGDTDPLRLVARLKAAGYRSDDFVLSGVEFADSSYRQDPDCSLCIEDDVGSGC